MIIKDAINRKFKNIYLGLGGTSTVDAGIGMAQALGIKFLSKTGVRLCPKKGKYFMGLDLSSVNDIVWDSISPIYKDVSITALCDSKINIPQMSVPTNMKISKYFDKDRVAINDRLKTSLFKYSRIIGKNLDEIYSHHSDYYKSLKEQVTIPWTTLAPLTWTLSRALLVIPILIKWNILLKLHPRWIYMLMR